MKDFYTLDKNDTRAYWKSEYGVYYTAKYECMECGATFYGTWHSKYTRSRIICPVCKDETDTDMILDKGNIRME